MGRLVANVVATFAVGMLALAANAGYAQTARSGGGGNAQLLQQLQQLASERMSLQAENAKLKKDLADMQKDRDALKNAQQVVDRRAKSSELTLKENLSQRASMEQELTQTKEKMQQLIAKFRDTLNTLRDVESESTTTKQTLATRDQDLKVCIDRNLDLYKLNQEVLTRLEHQSVWARMAQAEPFTKIKRAQLENLVDDYKGRADAQRLSPRQAGSSAPADAPVLGPPQPAASGSSPPQN
jgi:chromosome segregation ATPase